MRFTFCLLLLTAACQLKAATPPAAQLLPPDTLAVLSVPDWDKATGYWKESAQGKLFQDPGLKAFKEHLLQRFQKDFTSPLEREWGVTFTDYLDLLHGQVTIALTQNGWGVAPDASPGIVLLVDAKDKKDALTKRLSDLKKKLTDAGKRLKTDRIHDIEFTTLILTGDELGKALEKAFPPPVADGDSDDPDEKTDRVKGAEKTEITFGQTGSLLLVANNSKDLERILARQAGGLAPVLAEQGAYETSHAALFGDAQAFAWINFARVYEGFQKQLTKTAKSLQSDNPLMPRTDRLLAATGLQGLKTVAARLASNPDGTAFDLVLSVPQSGRQGIFRLVAPEHKDSAPPVFVGTDVMKFSRWRIDGQKAWNTLENLMTSVSPELAGLLQMGLQVAGKDRDPNFDLKKSLIGNLGSDFISLQKTPRSAALADLNAPPALFLIGSAQPEQLVQAMKAATGLMPLAGGEADVKEREFLGRKIYSLSLAALPAPEEGAAASTTQRQFSFAAGGGYAAMSSEVSLLEEYLRSTEASNRPLRELPGLSEAAQKVGGMSTGTFGYQNQAEAVRVWIESAKQESAALDKLFSLAPLAGGKAISSEERKSMRDWLDFSLLPPFDKIAKYFHFLVYSLNATDEGLTWKVFAPAPPGAK